MTGVHTFKRESVDQILAECKIQLKTIPSEVSMQLLVLHLCKRSRVGSEC